MLLCNYLDILPKLYQSCVLQYRWLVYMYGHNFQVIAAYATSFN